MTRERRGDNKQKDGNKMKRLLFGIFCMLFCGVCNSAQIVNVEYIHKLIEQQYGITVPYNSELTNPHVAANMKYLLTTIDAANSILNGEQITDYGTSEYATNVATDTVATLEMVRDHVRDYKFFATTTPDTTSFSFSISASGVFHIDWGDGTRQSYRKNNTTTTTYSHEYADAGEYVIKIGGYATGYTASGWFGSSISFYQNLNLAKIEGSLGAIFPTIKNTDQTLNQPQFMRLFSGCSNLSGTIPYDLFKNIYGQPQNNMFESVFINTNIEGPIPPNLFSGIYGQPTTNLYNATFLNCKKLQGPIPAGMFGNLYGTPASFYFRQTFAGCSNLTGNIPDGLFGNISGEPANGFFQQTFRDCSKLTGTSAKMNNQYLYEIWPDVSTRMYLGATGLTDYADIPSNWK